MVSERSRDFEGKRDNIGDLKRQYILYSKLKEIYGNSAYVLSSKRSEQF